MQRPLLVFFEMRRVEMEFIGGFVAVDFDNTDQIRRLLALHREDADDAGLLRDGFRPHRRCGGKILLQVLGEDLKFRDACKHLPRRLLLDGGLLFFDVEKTQGCGPPS